MPTHPIRYLLWYQAIFWIGILLPFNFTWPDAAAIAHATDRFTSLPLNLRELPNYAAHWLLFVPAGWLIWQVFTQHGLRQSLKWALVTFAIAVISEFSQLLLPERGVSAADFLLDLLGITSGLVLAYSYPQIHLPPILIKRTKLAAFLLMLIATTAYLYAIQPVESELSNWDKRYPLLLGNEQSMDRPWQGTLYQLALFNRAITADETPAKLPPEALGAIDPLLHYSFSAEPQATDQLALNPTNSSSPNLTLKNMSDTPARLLPDGGLYFPAGSLVSSDTLPPALLDSLTKNSQLTISATIRAEQPVSPEMVRIISLSASPYERNFTLGQQGNSLHFRVRTSATGANADRSELRSEPCLEFGKLHQIIASYNGRGSQIYVDGKRCGAQQYQPIKSVLPPYLSESSDPMVGLALIFACWTLYFFGLTFTLGHCFSQKQILGGSLLLCFSLTSVTWLA